MEPGNARPPVVLFAVLDWGMGHATRTAPLIQSAIEAGWVVHVASKGTALAFLKSQFKAARLQFHEKPGPDITYARRAMLLKIAAQMPEFFRSIRSETVWTAALVERHGIDRIVSDNCYGVHHPTVPAALISHQLNLPVPPGLEGLARRFVRHHAAKFHSVWIPDDGDLRLSGELAHAHRLKHTTFIGVLSRLDPSASPGPWKRVGMVSGPEPHRALMEDALRKWMLAAGEPALLIAGRPGDAVATEGCVTTWPDPSAAELSGALRGADTIVCRSGYSSLMDLAALGRRAVLIPTPGQPEQTYLAKHWARTFGMNTCTQRDLEFGAIPAMAGTAPSSRANHVAEMTLHAFVLNP